MNIAPETVVKRSQIGPALGPVQPCSPDVNPVHPPQAILQKQCRFQRFVERADCQRAASALQIIGNFTPVSFA